MALTQHLPDYQCAAYRRQAPIWNWLDDLYVGLDAWVDRLPDGTVKPNKKTKNYLPKFPKEHGSDYLARLIRTPYSDRFAQAIRDFVGLLFHSGVQFAEDFSPVIREQWSNLDNEGTPGNVFLTRVAITAMRRGHTFLMVDCPSAKVVSIADAAKARPYWIHIEATQVLSWRSQVIDGRRILTRVVIRQSQIIPDGDWGEKDEVSYLVLTPGRYDLYTIEGEGDKRRAVWHGDRSGVHGVIRGGRAVPFTTIPLVPLYAGLQTGLFESLPPLQALAGLNQTHYQLMSDHLSKIHACCFPTPVRAGTMGDEGELVLGPGVVVDVPAGGSFFYAEPTATSIQQSRTEIEALELVMDFLGTQFLVKPSDRQSAMVTLVQSAKIESSLGLFANDFVAGVNQAIAFHADYLSIAPSAANTVALDTKFFQQNPSDSQMLMAYTAFFEKLLSIPHPMRRLLLETAKGRGYLPQSFDVDVALSQIPNMPLAA